MRTIGVISDTHGLLRPQALAALEGSDLILHAGDVGDPEILQQIGSLAPVHAVYGNTDWGPLRGALAGTAVVDLDSEDGRVGEDGPHGPLAYILHDLLELDLDPVAAGFRLVVTGHTHRPEVRTRDGVLYLNPGSAGPRRFTLPVTVARVRVDGKDVKAEIVELEVER